MRKLIEIVTEEREVTGVIRDLVMFVKFLEACGSAAHSLSDWDLVALAKEYWDREHGE